MILFEIGGKEATCERCRWKQKCRGFFVELFHAGIWTTVEWYLCRNCCEIRGIA